MSYYERLKPTELIPNAYERWAGYREAITEMVLERAPEASDIVIFGAGACNDIELQQLVLKYSRVTLVDHNMEAMQIAIARIKENAERIDTVEYDFWPILEEEYKEYEGLLECGESVYALLAWLEGITRTLSSRRLELPIDVHQFGICLGLHSQICIMLATLTYLYRKQYTAEELKMIRDAIAKMNMQMAPKINEILLSTTNELLLGCEFTTISVDDAGKRVKEQVLEYLKSGKANQLHQLGLMRVEGAIQGEQEIFQRYQTHLLSIDSCAYLFWPFIREKEYLMTVYHIVQSENTKR